jgi:hypothetical protein
MRRSKKKGVGSMARRSIFRGHLEGTALFWLILAFSLFSLPAEVKGGVAQEWVAYYNGTGQGQDIAMAIAVDGQGNVYVTGFSWGKGGNHDYATVKYSPSGQQLWEARYNGPGNGHDLAKAVAVDAEGNVYVTGMSWGGPSTLYDYATVKYNSSGEEQWVGRYNGPGNGHDVATALVLDGQGHVVVTGQSIGAEPGWDYATIWYDVVTREGGPLVRRYNGPANGNDIPTALAVDREGCIYVTGQSENSLANYDYVTIKYNSGGDEMWAARRDCSFDDYMTNDIATGVAVDGQGNVFVTGISEVSGCVHHCNTFKYDSQGHELWGASEGGNWTLELFDVSIDGSVASWLKGPMVGVYGENNVYVVGGNEFPQTGVDYVIRKYLPFIEEGWIRSYHAASGLKRDFPTAMSMDGQGNVYITGTTTNFTGTAYDFLSVKYSPNGQLLWVTRYSYDSGSHDYPFALAVDGRGNVYITGFSNSCDRGTDYTTIKYRQFSLTFLDLLLLD